jgi:hypothetical protein
LFPHVFLFWAIMVPIGQWRSWWVDEASFLCKLYSM